MLTAHTVADIRAAEESLAATLPEGELMQRAARGLANALADIPAGDLVVMLIGPGNNGGDALYAATHLLDRGVRIDLCLLDVANVHSDALLVARESGAQVIDRPTKQRWCVDALFGIGGRPGLTGVAAEWAAWIDETRPYTIAVDVPSGIDVDGGSASLAVQADLTVTFGTYKVGLLAGPAAACGGSSIPQLIDIGLGPYLSGPALVALEADDPVERSLIDGPVDKYARGVLGIAAGSPQYAGAAHLCVAGAQAGGLAGMIRFIGDQALSARVVDRAPEVVAGVGRVQAWVVGPGGGDAAAEQLQLALKDNVPIIIDASALDHLPDVVDVDAVLTPHAGELARMLGIDRADVESDPLSAVRQTAARWQCTVLLKGKRTLIAHPDHPTRVNLTGTHWLATAGAGDVLAGLIGSFLASGMNGFEAASRGAFIHGAAAVRASAGGPITASAVAAAIPAVMADRLAGTLATVRDWEQR